MPIPELDSFEGLNTVYSDTELRQAIAIAIAVNSVSSGMIPALNSFEGLNTVYSETELRLAIAIAVASSILNGGSGGNFVDLSTNQVVAGIKNFTQNLGLGISTPQAKLHIDSGDAAASNIRFTAGATTGQSATDGFDIGIDAAGIAIIDQKENNTLTIRTNGTNRLVISGAGITTINSTQASTASNNGALVLSAGGLGVAGAINAGGNIFSSGQIAASTFLVAPTFRAGDNTAGTNTAGTNLTFRPGLGTGSGTLSGLIFQTPDVNGTATAAQPVTTKMTLFGSGNLGIGISTDNSVDKLQVNGSINTLGFINNLTSVNGASAWAGIAQSEFYTQSTTRIPVLVRGIGSQTANMQEWRSNGNTLLASINPSGVLFAQAITSNFTVTAPQFRQSANSTPPASASATGTLGEIRIDADFIYYCFATNQWKRAALSTW